MTKFVSLLLIMVIMFSLAACGAKNDVVEETTAAVSETTEATEAPSLDATISVQVESSWLEYYQAAADRVKAENPNATIDFIE